MFITNNDVPFVFWGYTYT